MKKYLLFLFGLNMYGTSLFAQVSSVSEAKLELGPVVFMSEQATIAEVDSQFVYTYNLDHRKGWEMERWTFTKHLKSDMSIVWQTKLAPIQWKDTYLAFEHIQVSQGEFIVFYSAFDRDKDEVTLISHRIASGERVGELYPLAKYETDEVEEGGFLIRWNPTGDRFAVIAQPQYLNAEKARFKARMYDNQFNEYFTFQVDSRLHHDDFLIVDATLSGNDQLNILTIDYRARTHRSGQKFKLIRCSADVPEPEFLDLELDRYFVVSPWIYQDENNLFIGGLSSLRSFDALSESFVLSVDPTSFTIQNQWFNDLNSKSRRLLNHLQLGEAFDPNSSSFEALDVVGHEEGGHTFILQIRDDETEHLGLNSSAYNSSSWDRSIAYYNEDFLIQSIDKEGIELWMNHIPLAHKFDEYELHTGCLILNTEAAIHLIFNDLPGNASEHNSTEPVLRTLSDYDLGESSITMATIHRNGLLELKQIGSTQNPESKLLFVPGYPNRTLKNEGSSDAFMLYRNQIQVGTLSIR